MPDGLRTPQHRDCSGSSRPAGPGQWKRNGRSWRRTVPRVLNTADSFELERDPLARIARLPGAAWRAAKDGLERGPVLVQVARSSRLRPLACL